MRNYIPAKVVTIIPVADDVTRIDNARIELMAVDFKAGPMVVPGTAGQVMLQTPQCVVAHRQVGYEQTVRSVGRAMLRCESPYNELSWPDGKVPKLSDIYAVVWDSTVGGIQFTIISREGE